MPTSPDQAPGDSASGFSDGDILAAEKLFDQHSKKPLGKMSAPPALPPSHAKEKYAVQVLHDGRSMGRWRCLGIDGPVCCSGAHPAYRALFDDGVEFNGRGLVPAEKLAAEWQLQGIVLEEGKIYTPKDGIRFLLALHASYCGGGRMWTDPSRVQVQVKPESKPCLDTEPHP
jgi:hypothetical protein